MFSIEGFKWTTNALDKIGSYSHVMCLATPYSCLHIVGMSICVSNDTQKDDVGNNVIYGVRVDGINNKIMVYGLDLTYYGRFLVQSLDEYLHTFNTPDEYMKWAMENVDQKYHDQDAYLAYSFEDMETGRTPKLDR